MFLRSVNIQLTIFYGLVDQNQVYCLIINLKYWTKFFLNEQNGQDTF